MEKRRSHVEAAKRDTDYDALRSAAREFRSGRERFRLSTALSNRNRINVIAEIKRASPSKGMIRDGINVRNVARTYEAGGAAAISVLTEPDHFRGSLMDLEEATCSVVIPILRKDFIVDEFQIYEAAVAGADAILLIVKGLGKSELELLLNCANELGLDALVEVHDQNELKIAARLGAELVGVNNRDLSSLEVSLDTSRELVAQKPEGVTMIVESGITSIDEILDLRSRGFDGFLIGEALMRSGEPADELRSWTAAQPS
jgi:indole-3-glycerol phosphate synthase